MPIGLFVMIALSVLASRRARSVGRNGLLWVAVLWLLTLGVGLTFAVCGAALAIVESDAPDELSDRELQAVATFPMLLGMIVGAATSLWACGRVSRDRYEDDDSFSDPDD